MQAQVMDSGLLLRMLEKNWWLLALRGVAAILFGVLAMAWPGVTLTVLVLLYGAFALVDGIFSLVAAIKGGSFAPRWWLAISGGVAIALGVLTFFWPGITALALLFLIAGWALVTGVLQVVGAIRLRREIQNEWLLIAGGVLSVLVGLALVIWPGAGALALIVVIGAFAIANGVLLVAFSLRLRRHERSSGRRT